MGLDLTLVPIQWPENGPDWLGYTRLSTERDSELYDRILNDLPAEPIPGALSWYGDDGLEQRTRDTYDDALMYVEAGQLGAFLYGALSTTNWNRAALKFCDHLPPETPVVLWWC